MKHFRSKKHTLQNPLKATFVGGMLGCLVLSVIIFNRIPKAQCANTRSCLDGAKESIEDGATGVFMGKPVFVPDIDSTKDLKEDVLGTSDSTEEKHIYVDLSVQKLYAFEGTAKIFETWVSTGRWGKTPTGNFNIWSKFRSTKMEGGSGSDYYNLPNVPFTMFFYKDFGLHGAYWHNNFGYTMSHGCVNLRQVDAEVLFNWADGPTKGKKGTAVSICDTFTEPNGCVQEDPVQ